MRTARRRVLSSAMISKSRPAQVGFTEANFGLRLGITSKSPGLPHHHVA